eukprot:TRINITY_DN52_c0_g1_i3.p1 TRINITY_DN52_c0_g1~~TRINITY_DN52_c0_g1_i3.p1  ORF type:complete len:665 (-),score=185.43 TRINITY_DN52_c0_g1_i3:192-2186(-)
MSNTVNTNVVSSLTQTIMSTVDVVNSNDSVPRGTPVGDGGDSVPRGTPVDDGGVSVAVVSSLELSVPILSEGVESIAPCLLSSLSLSTEDSSSPLPAPDVLVTKLECVKENNTCSTQSDAADQHRYTIETLLRFNTELQMSNDYSSRTERMIQILAPHYLNIGNPFPPSTYILRTPMSPVNPRPTTFGTPKQTMGLSPFYSPTSPRQPTYNSIRPTSPLNPSPASPLVNHISPYPLNFPLQSQQNPMSPTHTPLRKVVTPSPPTYTPPVNTTLPPTPKHGPLSPPKPAFVPKMNVTSPKSPSPTHSTYATPSNGPSTPGLAEAKRQAPSHITDNRNTLTASAHKATPRRSPLNKENKVITPSTAPSLKENINNVNNKNNNNAMTPLKKLQPVNIVQPQNTLSPLKTKQQNQVATPVSKGVAETPVKVKSQPQPQAQQPVPVTPVHATTTPRVSDSASATPMSPSKSSPSSPSSPSKCETDPHRLQQRQKQVDYGYRTLGYVRYRLMVPLESRDLEQPKTPRKAQCCSKRSWDGQVKKWRRDLHRWDPTDHAEFQKLTDPNVLATIFTNPNEIPLVLKQLEEQILELKQTGTLKIDDDAEDSKSTHVSPNTAVPTKDILSRLMSTPSSVVDPNESDINKPDTDDFLGEEDTTIQTKPSTVRMLVF